MRHYDIVTCRVTIRRGVDWMIGFIDHIHNSLTAGYYIGTANLHTLQFTVTPTSVLSLLQSSLAVSWQRILT
jgi:hypothetical protein